MKLLEICTGKNIEKLLRKSGMVTDSISSKVDLFKQAGNMLVQQNISEDETGFSVYVPGRIEVLGKHTDYAGGKSLVMAADRGICLVAVPHTENYIKIIGISDNKEVIINLDSLAEPEPGHWSNYPVTVIRRLMINFPDAIKGCTIAFGSDLPIASGMSSSSALIIAIFMALIKVSALHENPIFSKNILNLNDLAEYAATIENGLSFRELLGEKGVGTFGGSEDHTAILNCHAGMLSEFSYCPIEFHQHVNISDDYLFIVAASGVKAKKTGNAMDKYNRVSLLVSEIKGIWQKETGSKLLSLNDILKSAPGAKDELIMLIKISIDTEFPKQDLLDRLEHFVNENFEIIPTAVEALINQDFIAFGEDVDLSQEAAEKLLKNQVPETSFLCQSAKNEGAIAASAFGAGFGGSVWALIKNDEPEKFIQRWQKVYEEKFPVSAQGAGFFICRTGPAAFYLKNEEMYDALNRKL